VKKAANFVRKIAQYGALLNHIDIPEKIPHQNMEI
jgi:hypothetical protein